MAQHFSKLLRAAPLLAEMAGRAADLATWQKRVEEALPPGGYSSFRVCHVEAGVVHIATDEPATAALLRQRAATLVRALGSGRREVTAIRVFIQPVTREPVRPVRRPELPRDNLERLANSLTESPLRTVLERIAKGGKGYR